LLLKQVKSKEIYWVFMFFIVYYTGAGGGVLPNHGGVGTGPYVSI
jgi:hypothetical protein